MPAAVWLDGRRLARRLTARADAARDARHYRAAALLYDEALRIRPKNAAIHIQCGHMFKEAEEFLEAEAHYRAAERLTPNDPDLALQLGHLYKRAGRLGQSENSYLRAAALRPGWHEPLRELAELQRLAHGPVPPGLGSEAEKADALGLVAELLPHDAPAEQPDPPGRVHITRLGARRERSYWGMMPTLRGSEAIRGFCLSCMWLTDLHIALDGRLIHACALQGHAQGEGGSTQTKYVFNAWLDFSCEAAGLHRVSLHFLQSGHEAWVHTELIVVAPALSEADYPDCDTVVNVVAGDPRSVAEQINARPSMIRPARRSLFARSVRNLLVLRADQLGDLVVSVPALRRLRELFPQARIVALMTPSNVDLARSLGLVDEIIVVEFPVQPRNRSRIMPLQAQLDLRARLQIYDFDLAIDLGEDPASRPLLLLSGARFLYGFNDRETPWLTGGFDGNTHDARNNMETAAHSTKILALVERLGASMSSRAAVIRRADLKRSELSRFGLAGDERFIVLHTGARIGFSRWPHYSELAQLILQQTDLHVVLLEDDAASGSSLPATLARSAKFQLVDHRLEFDAFDALLSFCAVFVGNDSGPKHLAALRGVPVVSIHSSRINWNEWGQELMGSIISRRVPCAGCAIADHAEECGKDFVCVANISAEEVFGAVRDLVRLT